MDTSYIFYLAVEGVLLPRGAPTSRSLTDVYQVRDSRHAIQLADLLREQEHVCVVVNSLWVASFGFRYVLDLLPHSLHHRVIGATVPGNRILRHRHRTGPDSRYTYLAADVQRRTPAVLTVLEGDASSVPVPFRDDTVIVSSGLWAARFDDWSRLREKLARKV